MPMGKWKDLTVELLYSNLSQKTEAKDKEKQIDDIVIKCNNNNEKGGIEKYDCPNKIDYWVNAMLTTLRVSEKTDAYVSVLGKLYDLFYLVEKRWVVGSELKRNSNEVISTMLRLVKGVTFKDHDLFNSSMDSVIAEIARIVDVRYVESVSDALQWFNSNNTDYSYNPIEEARKPKEDRAIRTPIVKVAGISFKMHSSFEQYDYKVLEFWELIIKNSNNKLDVLDLPNLRNLCNFLFGMITEYLSNSHSFNISYLQKLKQFKSDDAPPSPLTRILEYDIDTAHSQVWA